MYFNVEGRSKFKRELIFVLIPESSQIITYAHVKKIKSKGVSVLRLMTRMRIGTNENEIFERRLKFCVSFHCL